MRTLFYSLTCFLAVAILTSWTCIAQAQQVENKIPITTSSAEAKALYIQARDLQEKFHFPESRGLLEEAIKLDESFALAHLLMAFTQPSNKGFLESLNRAVSLKDKVSEGERLIILAQEAAVNGNPAQQGEYLLTLVETYPQEERAHTLLATYYFAQQRYQDAITHFAEATEAAPDYSPAYNMLGYSNRALEKYDDAEKAFKKYTELIPNEPNPLDSYAELLLKMGRYEEALQAYRNVIALDSMFVNAHVGIASALTCQKRYNEARDELQKMMAVAVNDGQRRFALLSMVATYCDEAKFDDALNVMKDQYALAEKAEDDGAMSQDLINMGNIYYESGEYDKALAKFTESIEKIRESNLGSDIKTNAERLFLYNEARIALAKGELKSAKARSEEFTNKATEAGNTFQIWLTHELSGMIALEEKSFETALKELQAGNPQNPLNLYRIALAYQKMDNTEKAKEFCMKSANFNGLLALNSAFARPKAMVLMNDLSK